MTTESNSRSRSRAARHFPTTLAVGLAIVLAAAGARAADKTVVFHAGLNQAELGGDADAFGRSLAQGLQSDLGGAWTSDKGRLGGLALGAGYRSADGSSLGLQLEMQFVQRGTRFNLLARDVPGYPTSMDVDVDLKLSYLEVVVLGHFTPRPTAPVRPFLLAGPVLGLKAASDLKVTIEGESASQELTDGIAGATVGLLGGAGLAFQVGETATFVLQGRYYLGFTDLLDQDGGTTKAQDLALLAGLEFDIGP